MHLIAKDKQVLIFKNAQIAIWTVVTKHYGMAGRRRPSMLN